MEAGHVLQAVVTWRSTSFEPTYDPSTEYSRMLSELTRDASRNALIAADVAQETQGAAPGVCLVLSDRVAHCRTLVELLRPAGSPPRCLPVTCRRRTGARSWRP